MENGYIVQCEKCSDYIDLQDTPKKYSTHEIGYNHEKSGTVQQKIIYLCMFCSPNFKKVSQTTDIV